MLKIWCIHLFLFCDVVKKIGAFMIYSLSFNLVDLNWSEEQSTFIRYLFVTKTLKVFFHLSSLHTKISLINKAALCFFSFGKKMHFKIQWGSKFYILVQGVRVTCLFTSQYNTKGYGTITDDI